MRVPFGIGQIGGDFIGTDFQTGSFDGKTENFFVFYSFDGFTVLQLSDIHGRCFGKDNGRLLRNVEKANPDIIVITGDLADEKTKMGVIDSLLEALTEVADTYYVSGNHEWGSGCIDELQMLFDKHYSVSFHAIVGVVIAATVMIIPFESFSGVASITVNCICIAGGVAAALALDKFNSKFSKDEIDDKGISKERDSGNRK